MAAPESSNNAEAGGALIPMLTLGIPGDPITAILLGALMILGLIPGPLVWPLWKNRNHASGADQWKSRCYLNTI